MRKRKFILLLSVVLIASIALFTGLAQATPLDPNTFCNLVKKDGSDSGYTLTRDTNAEPVLPAKQTWRYTVTGFSGTQFAVVVSNPWPIPTDYTWPLGETWILEELPADLSNNWDGFGQWASGSPQKLLTFTGTGKTTFEFYTDKVLTDTFMPVQFKKGKDYLYCSISGPGWPAGAPLLSSLHSVCENILTGWDNVALTNVTLETPFSVLTTVDSASCSITVERHAGLNCADNTAEQIVETNMALSFGGANFASLECGSENQQCPICELRANKNPCSYTKYSGGRAYTIYYNCQSGKRCISPTDCPP